MCIAHTGRAPARSRPGAGAGTEQVEMLAKRRSAACKGTCTPGGGVRTPLSTTRGDASSQGCESLWPSQRAILEADADP